MSVCTKFQPRQQRDQNQKYNNPRNNNYNNPRQANNNSNTTAEGEASASIPQQPERKQVEKPYEFVNSLYNWAASVLLWLNISVGLLMLAMTLAMVNVFPDPVTPSNVCAGSPSCTPSVSCAMASGWSPVGW